MNAKPADNMPKTSTKGGLTSPAHESVTGIRVGNAGKKIGMKTPRGLGSKR